MNLEITFRHMEHTESIDDKIRQKIEKFGSRHLSPGANVKWTGWVENQDHIATLHVTDRGHEFHVKGSADSMYKTLDQVISKLESQLSHASHHPGR